MKSDWLEMRINDIQNTKYVSETAFMVIASVRLHVNTKKQRNIHLQRLIGYFQMRYVYTILRSRLYLSRTGISERMVFTFFDTEMHRINLYMKRYYNSASDIIESRNGFFLYIAFQSYSFTLPL